MEPLSAYIPQDRRRALARGAALPDRMVGAALFADISGFTPLTEALARALTPRRGAEELTRQLNTVYDALIAEVDRAGGSVIGFAGDAITCWFDDELQIADCRLHIDEHPNLQSPAALRAVACALAMQRIMGRFNAIVLPDGETMTLALKVAIASGLARRFLVGDPAIQQIDALAGTTVARMAAAEHLAGKGEVLVDEPTVARLGAALRVAGWRADDETGERFAVISELSVENIELGNTNSLDDLSQVTILNAQFPDATLTAEQIRPWLLPAVYDRLSAGLGEFLTELRPAVALFLRFEGIDYDIDEDADARLDAYIRWAQQTLARYEGTLMQLTIGDKGSYFCAVFGAPIAHEDDARRAVAAALELRAPPPGLVGGSSVTAAQIGISQGTMRAGACGGTTRRTYGVQGEEVNTAARLMSQAVPGQVLVAARTAQALIAIYDFQELGAMQFKGLAKPLAVFAVRGKRAGPAVLQARTAIVGRATERAILTEQLQALASGGGALVIEGEAGIGKSRLVEDLLTQAHALGIPALLGLGEAIEQTTPYHAWRPVFRALFGLADLEEPSIARQRILDQLVADPELLERAPLLNAVLPFGLPDNDLTAQLTGELRASNTRDVLLKLLLQATQASPTVLVIEDAHWLDSASWAFMEQVKAKSSALLLVVVTRPMIEGAADATGHAGAQVPDEYQRLLGASGTRHLQLGVLPLEEIPALICRRLGVASVPQPVIDLICRNAEGHPFFSEEIAYALRDMGILQISDGECRVSDETGNLRDLDFPETIQGVITSRFDRLPPAQQLALKVASVIGRIFLFRGLRDIHPVEADKQHLTEHMDRLARLDITPLETLEPELAYMFKHAITREVTYQLLLFSQRRRLHRAVAEWYEQTYADNLEPYYALLAYHWSQAVGDAPDDPLLVAKALEYLEQAGNQALQTSAHREAVEFFKQALDLDARQPPAADDQVDRVATDRYRRARWTGKIGAAYRGWGRFGHSKDWLERAVRLYGQPMPATRGRLVIRLFGELLRQIPHRLWPARFIGRAPAAARPLLLEIAQVYQITGEMAFFANQKGASLYAIVRMLNLSEYAGTSEEMARASGVMGLMSGFFGLHGLAELYYRRALETAQAVNQPLALGEILQTSGLYRLGMGQWTPARDNLRQSLAIHQRLQYKRHISSSTVLLAQIALYRAEFDEAMRLSLEVFRAGQRDDNPDYQIWSYAQQSLRALRMGRMDEVISMMGSALALVTAHSEGQANIYCRGLLALAHWRRGEQESARHLANQIARLIGQTRGIPVAYDVIDGYLAVAEIYLGLWEQERDRPSAGRETPAAARKACRMLHVYRRFFAIGKPGAWLYQGLCDWLAGRPAKAHKAWQKSLAAAERLEMPYEQAQALYEIGRHLPPGDSARAEHLRRASDTFERLGAAYDLKRTQESWSILYILTSSQH